jgi:hypothetical protein
MIHDFSQLFLKRPFLKLQGDVFFVVNSNNKEAYEGDSLLFLSSTPYWKITSYSLLFIFPDFVLI